MKTPKVGDYITFTTSTFWDGKKKLRRKITTIDHYLGIGVRYGGYSDYWITPKLGDKIHKIEKAVSA